MYQSQPERVLEEVTGSNGFLNIWEEGKTLKKLFSDDDLDEKPVEKEPKQGKKLKSQLSKFKQHYWWGWVLDWISYF